MPLPEARFNHFHVDHAGRTWSGEWRQIGAEVCVSGAYGSRRRAIGRRKPENVAADVLRELVDEWRNKTSTSSAGSSQRSRRATTATRTATGSR